MIRNYIRDRVLQLFFDFPRRKFQIREIVRILKIGQPSITRYLEELVEGDFISKQKDGVYPHFIANRGSLKFKLYKKTNLIQRINSSDFLDFVYDSCLPNSIVLFGSGSKGEDIEGSDIDIFVQSSDKKLNLKKYEKVLGRDINILFESDFSKMSNELKNNILNGDLLRGYLKVF